MFIIYDTKYKKYKLKSKGFGRKQWVNSWRKADLFKTKGACIRSLYSFNINPDKRLGAKIILPPGRFKFQSITVQF